MVDEEEWDWIVEHSSGAFDHLVIASTLPVFLPDRHPSPPGVERGALRRPLGPPRGEPERAAPPRGRPRALGGVQPLVRAAVRLAADARAAAPRAPEPPASILLLGGDVHCSSVSEVELGTTARAACTSSSARRSATRSRRRSGASCRRPARASPLIFSRARPLAGVEPPSASWRPLRAGDLRQLARRAGARRPHGVRDDPAEPARGRGSGAARRRSAGRARRDPDANDHAALRPGACGSTGAACKTPVHVEPAQTNAAETPAPMPRWCIGLRPNPFRPPLV